MVQATGATRRRNGLMSTFIDGFCLFSGWIEPALYQQAAVQFRRNAMPYRQKQDGGAMTSLMILAIIAYIIYVGIQYAPLYIESSSVDSILHTVADNDGKERLASESDVRIALDKQLYINEMRDFKGTFSIVPIPDGFRVTARYERQLNLLFKRIQIPFEKSVALQ
jgi:hypothetical protein